MNVFKNSLTLAIFYIMKITGVTIVRNAVLNDFPVLEAITSVLPVVDEMIVSIDKGDDDTDGLIRSIQSPKLKIVYSTWDMTLRKGGKVYALETDKAIDHVSADTDWIFYIQADEVIHEKYHTVIRQTAEKYAGNKRVDGFCLSTCIFTAPTIMWAIAVNGIKMRYASYVTTGRFIRIKMHKVSDGEKKSWMWCV